MYGFVEAAPPTTTTVAANTMRRKKTAGRAKLNARVVCESLPVLHNGGVGRLVHARHARAVMLAGVSLNAASWSRCSKATAAVSYMERQTEGGR